MKTDNIIDAVGYVDEHMAADAYSVTKRKIISLKRIAALAAAVLVVAAMSISALAAADVEPAYELLYAVSPRVAQTLKPVQESCVSQGIKMEVVSAAIHGSSADLLVGISDTEGDRIDGTVDLFDSYMIRGMGDSIGTCERQGYDPETGVATFLVRLENMDKSPIKSEKITFSVHRMLTDKTEFKDELNVDLSNIDSFTEYYPVSGAKITDLSYDNGRLSVIVYFSDILQYDNHGWVWLTDENGVEIEPDDMEDDYSGDYGIQVQPDEIEGGIIYEDGGELQPDDSEINASEEFGASVEIFEDGSDVIFEDGMEVQPASDDSGRSYVYSFNVPENELGSYKLNGYFVTCDTLIEGDWEVTFPMK